MFESLFGADMPLALKFFVAFVIVLAALGVFFWALRYFTAGRLSAGTRGRQPRLSVTDYATVDPRRRLILVRRDNVEHLLMIGGPTDVVVEANIVRAVAAPRDVAVARPAAVDPLPRAIPLPENGNGGWPLAPEPVTPPAPRTVQVEPAAEEPAIAPLQPAAEDKPARSQRDTLSALADELSTRPAPMPTRSRALGSSRTQPAEARTESRPAEPRLPTTPASAPAADAAATDQSLAEMAHRLEAALRKPTASATPASEQATAPEPAAPPPPRAARPVEPKPAPARTDAKPNKSTTLYDNLEQEMASLLGRPTNRN